MFKKKKKPQSVDEQKESRGQKAKETDRSGHLSGAFSKMKLKKSAFSFNPSKSVGGKIFVAFFVSIVLLVLIVGIISYQISSNVIQNSVSDALKQTLIQASERLDMTYERYESMSLEFILDRNLNDLFGEYIAGDLGERITLRRTLDDRVSGMVFSDDALQAIHIIELNGDVSHSIGSSLRNSNVAEEEWFQQTLEKDGRAHWMETRPEGYSADARNTFAIARKIKHVSRNHDIGVVVLEININAIGNQLERISFGDSGELYVVDGEGNIMFSFANEQIGGALALTESGKEGIVLDEEGQERLAVQEKSRTSNGWSVIGTVLVGELVADARGIFTATITVAILAAILAAIIGYAIAQLIGGPLRHLSSLMEEGAQGNLSVRTQFKHRDEIGQLGKSFNEMMEQITELVRQTNDSAQNVLETAIRLSDVSKQTAASAKEISVASEQIAGGAMTLASEAERGNELTQGIGERMKAVIESNMVMGQSANEVRLSSEQGAQYMATVIEKTNETEEMTRSMVEKVDRLKESTTSIRKILDMLNNITKQTNILSLNATIEASRAGAAGKGFMVVADEIRKLADQSKESIDVVGEITETIQREIDETVQVLSEAYPIFQEQTRSVKEADTIFHNVQQQMNEFIKNLDEVTSSVQQLEEAQTVLSEAMSNVSAVSQESSATSEEVASLTTEQLKVSDGLVQLSEQLESLSKSLKESLSRFKI